MWDWIWLGAAGVLATAGVAVAALGHILDRRARRETMRRLAARPPVQLVREPQPLEESKVLGRIGPAGRAR